MQNNHKAQVSYQVVMSRQSMEYWEHYFSRLLVDPCLAGKKLGKALSASNTAQSAKSGSLKVLEELFNTKPPRCFAESEVKGDGSDWSGSELKILGDMAVICPVTVYDNGWHHDPMIHEYPFSAHLVFVAGALLRSCHGDGVDAEELVKEDRVDFQAYCTLYERRLYPSLFEINEKCRQMSKKALVSIPSIGCGQFAGRFRSGLTSTFEEMLKQLLEKVQGELSHIKYVYYNPWTSNESCDVGFEHTTLLVRGSNRHRTNAVGQLASPSEILGFTDKDELELYSFVAWDHVSWPGNDFYAMDRCTDDGVKAAATSLMTEMTGIEGCYDSEDNIYKPCGTDESWEQLVLANNLRLVLNSRNLKIHQHHRE